MRPASRDLLTGSATCSRKELVCIRAANTSIMRDKGMESLCYFLSKNKEENPGAQELSCEKGQSVLTHGLASLGGAGLYMSLSASDVTTVRPLREFLVVARETGTVTKSIALNPSGVVITATLLTAALLAAIFSVAKFAPSMARLAALRFVPREEAAHAGETIKSEIKRILANVRKFGQVNDHYTKALTIGNSRLANTDRPDQLRSIVSSLVEENEQMRLQSVELKGQLYDTERSCAIFASR